MGISGFQVVNENEFFIIYILSGALRLKGLVKWDPWHQ